MFIAPNPLIQHLPSQEKNSLVMCIFFYFFLIFSPLDASGKGNSKQMNLILLLEPLQQNLHPKIFYVKTNSLRQSCGLKEKLCGRVGPFLRIIQMQWQRCTDALMCRRSTAYSRHFQNNSVLKLHSIFSLAMIIVAMPKHNIYMNASQNRPTNVF